MEQIQRDMMSRPAEIDANREGIDQIMSAIQHQLAADDRGVAANNNSGD